MTAQHKAALAQGREEGRHVRRYLEALEQHRPRRGRKRTPESVKRRLETVRRELDSEETDALSRLHLLQEQADLEAELARSDDADELARLEQAFVKIAAGYGQRKGISYATWRAAGVSPEVLARAGIPRSTHP